MKVPFAVLAIAALLSFVTFAEAADPSTIMGKWIKRSQSGAGFVTEFSPTSMAYYQVDETGKLVGEQKKASATFKYLDGETIGVTVANGPAGILVVRKGADVITVDIPGMMALDFTRLPSR